MLGYGARNPGASIDEPAPSSGRRISSTAGEPRRRTATREGAANAPEGVPAQVRRPREQGEHKCW